MPKNDTIAGKTPVRPHRSLLVYTYCSPSSRHAQGLCWQRILRPRASALTALATRDSPAHTSAHTGRPHSWTRYRHGRGFYTSDKRYAQRPTERYSTRSTRSPHPLSTATRTCDGRTHARSDCEGSEGTRAHAGEGEVARAIAALGRTLTD